MACFQNILVGIDLAHGTPPLSASALPPIAQEVFRRAVWLAQKTGGTLTFLSTLHLIEEAVLILEEGHRLTLARRIEQEVRLVLTELVRQAGENGVKAAGVFAHGEGAVEIVRQVLRGGHDLVLVGTRNLTGVQRMLFGNTALKLFRQCPCPVWVMRPEPFDRPRNVLVASDLQPASDHALQLALSLTEMVGSTLHVLHAIEYPIYHLWLTALPDEVGSEYHDRLRRQAKQALDAQLARVRGVNLSRPIQVHIADRVGNADNAILQVIAEQHIDLLVLATMSHTSVSGLLMGHTAERLLPDVSCAVLAVKPVDFVCPLEA
ncbi:MAG TPA: universal stress protein [Gemmataceae bacterium]|nr:universal stress protein [Gemmataceae bacterium]